MDFLAVFSILFQPQISKYLEFSYYILAFLISIFP